MKKIFIKIIELFRNEPGLIFIYPLLYSFAIAMNGIALIVFLIMVTTSFIITSAATVYPYYKNKK